MPARPSIVWFRQDLRLDDNPAWRAAIAKGGPVIPLYIWAPEEEGEWAPGGASKWWLHHSLLSLQHDLHDLGLILIIRQQSALKALLDLIHLTQADAVFWNRCFEPQVVQRDLLIATELSKRGIQCQIFNASLLFDPETLLTRQNKPYQVFTPFYKACCLQGEPPRPMNSRNRVLPLRKDLSTASLQSLGLLPIIRWDEGLKKNWRPGSRGAHQQLNQALTKVIGTYSQTRDVPAIEGTSKLSPYLHFGEISPRTVWHKVREKSSQHLDGEAFLRQLLWREFAYYLLYHFPRTPNESLRRQFDSFAWARDDAALQAWKKGITGYPIVDAGMRQLWQTGWMHNRIRMVAGSFLVKDLQIDWREGAHWFWDTLVDADLANNTLGWQWVAGCGADAAPYFRIFNPVLQGEKFDPSGDYIRKWVPELEKLPNRWIHRPWEAPQEILQSARVSLGRSYPWRIVNHEQARKIALEAFAQIKNKGLS